MNSSPDDIPALPGIDSTAGLKIAMQDAAFYRSLLIKFRGKHADYATRLNSALGTDPEQLIALAHGLKGLSGNLGMTDLHAASTDLESAGRNGDTDLHQRVEAVNRQLERVLGGLETL